MELSRRCFVLVAFYRILLFFIKTKECGAAISLTSSVSVIIYSNTFQLTCSSASSFHYLDFLYLYKNQNTTLQSVNVDTVGKCTASKSCTHDPCIVCNTQASEVIYTLSTASFSSMLASYTFYCKGRVGVDTFSASLTLPMYAPVTGVAASDNGGTKIPLSVEESVTCRTEYGLPTPRIEAFFNDQNITLSKLWSYTQTDNGLSRVTAGYSIYFPLSNTTEISYTCSAINSEGIVGIPSSVQTGFVRDKGVVYAFVNTLFDIGEYQSSIPLTTVFQGDTVMFTTKFFASPQPTVTWSYNLERTIVFNNTLSREVVVIRYQNKDYTLYGYKAQLFVPNVKRNYTDFYSMKSEVSKVYSTHRYFQLEVWQPPLEMDLVLINSKVESGIAPLMQGVPASFQCSVHNVYPEPIIEWMIGTVKTSNSTHLKLVSTSNSGHNETYTMTGQLDFVPSMENEVYDISCRVMLTDLNLSNMKTLTKSFENMIPPVFETSSIDQKTYLGATTQNGKVCVNFYTLSSTMSTEWLNSSQSVIQASNRISIVVTTAEVTIPDGTGLSINKTGYKSCMEMPVVETWHAGKYQVQINVYSPRLHHDIIEETSVTLLVEEPPITPSNLTVVSSDSTSIHIRWNYPLSSRIPLWFEVKLGVNYVQNIPFQVNRTMYELTISNLTQNTVYELHVKSLGRVINSTTLSSFVATTASGASFSTDYVLVLVFVLVAVVLVTIIGIFIIRSKNWLCWKSKALNIDNKREEHKSETKGENNRENERVENDQTAKENTNQKDQLSSAETYYAQKTEIAPPPVSSIPKKKEDIDPEYQTLEDYYIPDDPEI